MHLSPSDPDVATLYRKIHSKRLDLQPNFQRGEVWGKAKKQRLIDSILRSWHIPPIHVIQIPNSDKQEVLDGQQRLAAIRDFKEGAFPICGYLEPLENYIVELDGLFWENLPSDVQGKFDDFTIRILTISDFKPGEPGELFYRLNQPTNLTSAEQRNAYFGEARQQIKDLTEYVVDLGFSSDTIGFSNSRMAYDDVLAKFLLTLEIGNLNQKITANSVTARYRETTGFKGSIIQEAKKTLKDLIYCVKKGSKFKFNKATIHSWLLFIFRFNSWGLNQSMLNDFFIFFEVLNNQLDKIDEPFFIPKSLNRMVIKKILEIYHDRSSSRVADVSSVILRDLVLWVLFASKQPSIIDYRIKPLHSSLYSLASQRPETIHEDCLQDIANSLDWGDLKK